MGRRLGRQSVAAALSVVVGWGLWAGVAWIVADDVRGETPQSANNCSWYSAFLTRYPSVCSTLRSCFTCHTSTTFPVAWNSYGNECRSRPGSRTRLQWLADIEGRDSDGDGQGVAGRGLNGCEINNCSKPGVFNSSLPSACVPCASEPTLTLNGSAGNRTFQIDSGTPLSIDVIATTGDLATCGQVTLSVSSLPSGANMNPALPRQGSSVSSTFSWTPTDAQAGSRYDVVFRATDDEGNPTSYTATILVGLRQDAGVVSLYTDQNGTTCDVTDAFPGLIQVFVFTENTFNLDASRISFGLDGGTCFDPTFICDQSAFGITGDIDQGFTVTFSPCLSAGSRQIIATMIYFGRGTSDPCCVLRVVPNQQTGVLGAEDCGGGAPLDATAKSAIVNPTPSCVTCPTLAPPVFLVKTWGAVKSLYGK